MAKNQHEKDEEPSLEFACKDTESGYEGRLIIRDDIISLTQFSFKDPIDYPGSSRFAVQLETANFATLLDCIAAYHGSSFSAQYEKNVWRRDITPNTVLIGPRIWAESDRVRTARFTFPHAVTALHYAGHIEQKFESGKRFSSINFDKCEILNVKSNGMIVKLWMSVSSTLSAINPKNVSIPYVHIEFDDGVSIQKIFEETSQIKTFFELSLGHRSRVKNLTVTTQAEEGTLDDLEKMVTEDEFKVRTYSGEWLPTEDPTHIGDVLMPVRCEATISNARASLTTWLDRRSTWQVAYALASNYLRSAVMYDRDRLLRLMAWFEAIPAYQKASKITRSDLAKIVKEAKRISDQESIPVSAKRLQQVLAELRRTPLRERLSNAIGDLRSHFGGGLVPSSTGSDCDAAIDFRNRAAHGQITAQDHEFENFARSIHALELVCLLSMLKDLKPELRTMNRHPLMIYLWAGSPTGAQT